LTLLAEALVVPLYLWSLVQPDFGLAAAGVYGPRSTGPQGSLWHARVHCNLLAAPLTLALHSAVMWCSSALSQPATELSRAIPSSKTPANPHQETLFRLAS
jgi:hypothetical protein